MSIPAVKLRPYQQDGVDQIRAHIANGVKRICYQLPTGGGKTVIFIYVVASAMAKGSRVLILARRVEIMDQIVQALVRFGVGFGVISAGYPLTHGAPVQVASVFTLVRRLGEIGDFDLIVIDECDHAVASTWLAILAALPRARVLGVSATPSRLDGKELDNLFEVLVHGPSVRELIDLGFLAPFVAYGPKVGPDLRGVGVIGGDYRSDQLANVMNRGVVIDSAVTEYQRLCQGAPAIAFCVDLDHSRRVANAFRAEGWRACHVDGHTPRDERRDMIASLGDGRLDMLTNCGLISEGLDVPGVTAAILLRPTMSRALYLQQVGRALRPGKPKALILDHGGCTLRHGLPDAPYVWSLAGQQPDDTESTARQCEACGAFNSREDDHCAACGAALVVHRPPPESEARFRPEVASELMEIKGSDSAWLAEAPFGEAIRWAGRDRHRLHQVARARGYKPGWVHYRLKEAAQ